VLADGAVRILAAWRICASMSRSIGAAAVAEAKADRAPVLEEGPWACPPRLGSFQASPRRMDGVA
jgi:hypothetical protein